MTAMNAKNPAEDLLGHFAALGRYCDLCSIDMEDAIRIAQELERIRNASQTNTIAIDAWWREFCGTLASLHDLYLALHQPTLENEATRRQARDLVKDGTRTGSELFEPLRAFIRQIRPEDVQAISEIALDLLDSVILKFYSLLGNA